VDQLQGATLNGERETSFSDAGEKLQWLALHAIRDTAWQFMFHNKSVGTLTI